MQTYHLFKDFGVYKATIKKNFHDNDRGPEHNDVRDLLERRTQNYTLDEIRKLSGFLWTAHDDCVDENPDDYLPIQVRTAREKIKFGQAVIQRLDELQGKDSV